MPRNNSSGWKVFDGGKKLENKSIPVPKSIEHYSNTSALSHQSKLSNYSKKESKVQAVPENEGLLAGLKKDVQK